MQFEQLEQNQNIGLAELDCLVSVIANGYQAKDVTSNTDMQK